ncbi:sensor histidine kinase [Roseateles cellulosilyticus]|uniref:histidine kinase n=1 Tax=Pelomonas cellulosilytica TaxID=2906762 RepID=A0ABS8XQM5_9BURK|nr:HAMP domain-containing sensor histidine kinase [Pelomonas sp. P8]MCE4554015.1 HAMP domain-containing histidine kinase [Pelomonas sp. P8]
MASERRWRPIFAALALVGCGATAAAALHRGYWGLLTGALLAAAWLVTSQAWRASHRPGVPECEAPQHDALATRLLLDAAPTPMLSLRGGQARALNRAARQLFATDDRVLPLPPELADPQARHLSHESRRWRIDRVAHSDGVVAALVDIDHEERAAEARASAELVQVLGHELLNGLAPIASLAESALAATAQPRPDAAMLRDILATLARRADGLQRFAEAYRALARLPDPVLMPVAIGPMLDDLGRLFTARWPGIALAIEAEGDPQLPLDRDQVCQALWALLQNAAEAASGHAQPRVTLAARLVNGGLAMDVGDNGPPIPPDAATRIFRPFHTTKPDGTGIGLSLARQVARAHGGSLVLRTEGVKSFRLQLPAAGIGEAGRRSDAAA